MATKPKIEGNETKIVSLRPAFDQMPPFLQADLADYAGAGVSKEKEDNLVPFLYIAQSGTPEAKPREPNYIQGLEPGMVFNTASKRFWPAAIPDDEGPLVIQAHFRKAEIEWKPNRGGFVAEHLINTPLLEQITLVPKAEGKGVNRVLLNGNVLVTTAYHYLIMADTLEPVAFPLTSTGMQASRTLNTMLNNKKLRGPNGMITPSSFSSLLRLRTAYRTQDQYSWFQATFVDQGWVTSEHMDAYELAKAFHESAMKEGIRTQPPEDQTALIRNDTETNHQVDDSPL